MTTSLWNAKIKKLSYQEGNRTCADCNNPYSQWVSINIGCFLCLRCAGVHRSIGAHITKIRSITLDNWTGQQYNFLRQLGNVKVNSIYEATVPKKIKPTTKTGDAPLKKYIEDKYMHKYFYRKPLCTPSTIPEPVIKPTEVSLIDLSTEDTTGSFF